MNKRLLVAVMALGVVFSTGGCKSTTLFQSKRSYKKEQAEKNKKDESEEKKAKDYKKITKDATTQVGLFTIHLTKDGKLYFEMPDSVFQETFLLSNRIARTSNNKDFVAGQMVTDPVLLRFSKGHEKVFMHLVQYRNAVKDAKDPILASYNRNFIDPVVSTFKVEAENGSNVVIDVTSFFASNEEIISPLRQASPFDALTGNRALGGNVNRDATFISSAKSFPQNIEIKTNFTFDTRDDGPYTLEAHRSLFVAPREPMKIRLQDNRVGYFSSGKNLYSSSQDRVRSQEYIHRWRVEPKEEDLQKYFSGQLVEPKSPIVFYVDTAFPDKWRDVVRQGILDWNIAFEEAGFKNVMVAKDFPSKEENPDFDPDDMRYSCIKYALTDIANAMGPSYVDPRTGEILAGDVIWYHNVLSLVHDWRFSQTGAVDYRTHKKVFEDELMRESLRYVAAHEIGHTLGLMHNMGASYSFPVDSLRSPSFTQKYGTTPSIMDYARNNFVAQPGDLERGVKMTPPILGVYDISAINWGYRMIPGNKTPEQEREVMNEWIAKKANDPMYEFGAQQFMVAVDPTDQSEDLGNDHIKAGNYSISNLKIIMANLEKWTMERGANYEEMKDTYREIVRQYYRHVGHVIPYIGGVVFKEVRQGDNLPSMKYISKKDQKAAVRWLIDQANTFNSWLSPEDLLNKMGLNTDVNQKIVKTIANSLFDAGALYRIGEGYKMDSKNNYSIIEYTDETLREAFAPTLKGKALNEGERFFQSSLVNHFALASGLEEPKKSSKGPSLVHEDEDGHNCKGFCMHDLMGPTLPCSHYHGENSFFRVTLGMPVLNDVERKSIMTSMIKQVRDWYKQAVNRTSDAETRNYYRYQLMYIEHLLEK